MMICMDHHDTSPPLHPTIPITCILLHSISLVAFSSSSHFTHCLHHQPQVIPQSSVPTWRAYPSHNHVRMFLVMVVSLIRSRNKFNTSPSIMHHTHSIVNFWSADALTLPSFLSSLTWTWIASLDIINVFRFSLPHPHSYHHIPYVFCVEVQRVLHILSAWLAIDPFDIATWDAFLFFHY